MDRQASAEWRAQLLHTWQLAVLRFAITLDDADRLHLLAIADEIDRGGQFDRQSSFSFFRSCSTELCAAILRQNDSADAILRHFAARIEDARLRRAFAAAVGIRSDPGGSKSRQPDWLWRGPTSRDVCAGQPGTVIESASRTPHTCTAPGSALYV